VGFNEIPVPHMWDYTIWYNLWHRLYHSLEWYTLVTLVYTTPDYGITYI